MPIIPSSGSVTLPPVPSATYDTYWLKRLVISAPDLVTPVTVVITLLPYNSTTGETFPDYIIEWPINDILTLCQSDSILANTVSTIFAEVQRQGQLAGLI